VRVAHDDGGLWFPKCYHNPECTFDAKHPSGASYYSGADIHYKGEDGNGHQALLWKWATDPKPGPRACIGGACYVFRRDWYYEVGRPLAALPGWGGDEEALSISAWLSGRAPMLHPGRVAHRWRKGAPWKLTPAECEAIHRGCRAAMIAAIVPDAADRADLMAWQGCKPAAETPEVVRWRAALLRQPRTWAQWKASVPIMAVPVPAKIEPPRRKNTPNLVAAMHGVVCPHCHVAHDPKQLRVTHTWPNGNRRHHCAECGRPFISHFHATT
jgi:hypothetical protein